MNDSNFNGLKSVDCTADESEELCEANGIEGFPTLMYGDPDFLETYEGSREFDELYVFATSHLKATCSPKNIDMCNGEEKAQLEELMKMPIEELEADVKSIDDAGDQMETDFDESTDGLEDEYMAMLEENKKAKDEAKASANYDVLKAVLSLKKASGNDEL